MPMSPKELQAHLDVYQREIEACKRGIARREEEKKLVLQDKFQDPSYPTAENTPRQKFRRELDVFWPQSLRALKKCVEEVSEILKAYNPEEVGVTLDSYRSRILFEYLEPASKLEHESMVEKARRVWEAKKAEEVNKELRRLRRQHDSIQKQIEKFTKNLASMLLTPEEKELKVREKLAVSALLRSGLDLESLKSLDLNALISEVQ